MKVKGLVVDPISKMPIVAVPRWIIFLSNLSTINADVSKKEV
jgi:hypothetical protein